MSCRPFACVNSFILHVKSILASKSNQPDDLSLIPSHLSLNHEGRYDTTDDFTASFLHFSLFPTAPWHFAKLRACPFPEVVFPPLPLSAWSSPFHCALQDGFGRTWWMGDMIILRQFASLYSGQEVFVWSDCLPNLGTDFFIGNMVFVSWLLCTKEEKKKRKEKKNSQNWLAISVLDAFGKPTPGVLDGNFIWLGGYKQCFKVRANTTVTSHPYFSGQYCTARIPMSVSGSSRLLLSFHYSPFLHSLHHTKIWKL